MSTPENKKHALQQALEDAGLCVRSYSGRGMYGSRCLAVDGTIQEIMRVIVIAAAELAEREEIVEAMEQSWEIDSMGREQVVYWPRIAFVEDNLDICEFDECDEAAAESCGELRLCARHAKEYDDLCLRQALAHERRGSDRG